MRKLLAIFLLLSISAFASPPSAMLPGGGGVVLDGTDDYIALPAGVSIASTTWTVECWVKTSTVATQTVFSAQTGRMDLLITSGGKLAFYDGTTNDTSAQAYPTDGGWHHVVWRPSISSIFLDGVGASTTVAVTGRQLTGTCRIGTQYSSAAYFSGTIRDFRVWSTARTQTEIQQNMYAKLTGREAGLKYYLPLVGGGGTVATDTVSDLSQYPPFAGRYSASKSLRFDGNNDKVTTPEGDTFAGATAATVLMWVTVFSQSADRVFFFEDNGNGGTKFQVGMSAGDGKKFVGGFRDIVSGSQHQAVDSTNYDLSRPYFLAFTVDSVADLAKLYVNGEYVASYSSPFGPVCASASNLRVFAYTGVQYTNCIISNVGKYSRALSQSEIQAQMYANYPVSYVGLIDYWPMNEGTGNCVGVMGNTATVTGATWSTLTSNDGTLTNGPTWLQAVPNVFIRSKIYVGVQ